MKPNDFEILDNMSEIILIEDEIGNIKYANQAFCRCFGVTAQDAADMSIFDFIIPEDRDTCNVEKIVTPKQPDYIIEGSMEETGWMRS